MAKLTIDSLSKSNTFPPVLMLYGADSFSMEESLNSLLKMLVKTENDEIDYTCIDAEESSQNAVVSIALQSPMLSEKRIVVVKRFDAFFAGRRKKSDTTSIITKYLESPNTSTTIILLADTSDDSKLDFTKPPYSIIQKKHQVIEFAAIPERNLPNWIVNRFYKKGINISLEAAELLVSQTPPNLRTLANELDKISLYYMGSTNISANDVIHITGASRQNTVFELVKAVGNKSISRAIEIMSNILATTSQEILIITLLTDFFTKLFKLIELNGKGYQKEEIAKAIGLRNSYFLNDYTAAITKYSPVEIANIFSILCEADISMKSTNSNSKLIIEKMLIDIMQSHK